MNTLATTDNWLKRAQAAQPGGQEGGQAAVQPQPATNGLNGGGQPQAPQQAPGQPQGATQQARGEQVGQQSRTNQPDALLAVQEVAQKVFPDLDLYLRSMVGTIMALNATEDVARRLAVELVGAWLVATSTGQVSKPSDVVAGSARITSLIGMGK